MNFFSLGIRFGEVGGVNNKETSGSHCGRSGLGLNLTLISNIIFFHSGTHVDVDGTVHKEELSGLSRADSGPQSSSSLIANLLSSYLPTPVRKPADHQYAAVCGSHTDGSTLGRI